MSPVPPFAAVEVMVEEVDLLREGRSDVWVLVDVVVERGRAALLNADDHEIGEPSGTGRQEPQWPDAVLAPTSLGPPNLLRVLLSRFDHWASLSGVAAGASNRYRIIPGGPTIAVVKIGANSA